MLADAHCHLSFPEFDPDRTEVILRMQAAGVTLLIDPGTDLASSRRSVELSKQYSFIKANVGLHPHEAEGPVADAVYEALEELAGSPEVVAIGEIGLDYHYPGHNPRHQEEAFRTMLRMAAELDLPVVIHSRDAWPDTLRILDEERHSGLRGIMHCFSGDTTVALECIRRGLFISIPGTITFKRSILPEVVRSLPLASLLAETDAPYLAPVPFRGKRNEPAHVRLVAEAIADARSITPEAAAEALYRNTLDAFGISG
jgi:TatD DNase family protein